MWKESKLVRIWDVIYPVGMYLVITNLVMFALGLFLPETSENYIVRHMIVTVVVFPFIWSYYKNPPVYCLGMEEKRVYKPLLLLVAAVTGAAWAVFFNHAIWLTPLIESSQSYQEVSKAFYGSTLVLEILATCVLTPVLEEVLYRGVAYRRLRGWLGIMPAVLLSAALFGAMHLNMVQFVYAGLIGVFLGWLMEQAGLVPVILAHVGANLVSVLRSECSFLVLGQTGEAGGWLEMGGALVLGVAGILVLKRMKYNSN